MSFLLLLLFPCILLGMVYVFLAVVNYLNGGYYNNAGEWVNEVSWQEVNMYFLGALPWVIIGVGIWFAIAYFANTSMIAHATNARPLERRENPRVYNIVENLCMTCGMDMPQINVVNDDMLNAFASGINKKTYTVTVTTGLLNTFSQRVSLYFLPLRVAFLMSAIFPTSLPSIPLLLHSSSDNF